MIQSHGWQVSQTHESVSGLSSNTPFTMSRLAQGGFLHVSQDAEITPASFTLPPPLCRLLLLEPYEWKGKEGFGLVVTDEQTFMSLFRRGIQEEGEVSIRRGPSPSYPKSPEFPNFLLGYPFSFEALLAFGTLQACQIPLLFYSALKNSAVFVSFFTPWRKEAAQEGSAYISRRHYRMYLRRERTQFIGCYAREFRLGVRLGAFPLHSTHSTAEKERNHL